MRVPRKMTDNEILAASRRAADQLRNAIQTAHAHGLEIFIQEGAPPRIIDPATGKILTQVKTRPSRSVG